MIGPAQFRHVVSSSSDHALENLRHDTSRMEAGVDALDLYRSVHQRPGAVIVRERDVEFAPPRSTLLGERPRFRHRAPIRAARVRYRWRAREEKGGRGGARPAGMLHLVPGRARVPCRSIHPSLFPARPSQDVGHEPDDIQATIEVKSAKYVDVRSADMPSEVHCVACIDRPAHRLLCLCSTTFQPLRS